jgi:hypothetical protein
LIILILGILLVLHLLVPKTVGFLLRTQFDLNLLLLDNLLDLG